MQGIREAQQAARKMQQKLERALARAQIKQATLNAKGLLKTGDRLRVKLPSGELRTITFDGWRGSQIVTRGGIRIAEALAVDRLNGQPVDFGDSSSSEGSSESSEIPALQASVKAAKALSALSSEALTAALLEQRPAAKPAEQSETALPPPAQATELLSILRQAVSGLSDETLRSEGLSAALLAPIPPLYAPPDAVKPKASRFVDSLGLLLSRTENPADTSPARRPFLGGGPKNGAKPELPKAPMADAKRQALLAASLGGSSARPESLTPTRILKRQRPKALPAARGLAPVTIKLTKADVDAVLHQYASRLVTPNLRTLAARAETFFESLGPVEHARLETAARFALQAQLAIFMRERDLLV
ncbi:hypothetical protein BI364_13670 [Acidihalobacter yilgarnensis]|uniref:Uncharacterized protein n=1 Tax=Acidihalobacter yilgarnensis TaxID=2819280 RepID=A0A1D8IQX0_9GAMM|nr:hypothetical protein [Acidihalobacter yilgarnensis]AOU98866.1 hypothetical protein BI364_13670 [Acidihalobacter yilgarnensis]